MLCDCSKYHAAQSQPDTPRSITQKHVRSVWQCVHVNIYTKTTEYLQASSMTNQNLLLAGVKNHLPSKNEARQPSCRNFLTRRLIVLEGLALRSVEHSSYNTIRWVLQHLLNRSLASFFWMTVAICSVPFFSRLNIRLGRVTLMDPATCDRM